MIRDGLQECEARIFIESIMLSDESRKQLGKDLVDRCRRLLNLRRSYVHSSQGLRGAIVFLGTGRQDRVRQLYSLAGEVESEMKGK